jgi:hypothetical protein
MKNEEIKFKDLIDGAYYKATFKENPKGIIFKFNKQIGNKHYYINLDGMYFNNEVILTCRPKDNTYIKLNKQEEHWLNCCIEANEFISYEEAMKTFKEEPENTSLVGRYLKALVSEPEYTNFKAGDYVKIKSLRKTNAYEVTLDGLLAWGASPSKKDLWELMPISWSPDEEGKVNDEIPEYVKCIKGHNCSFHNKVGTIYKVENYDLKNKKLQLENFDNTISYIDFKNPISSNLTDYTISSKAEYDLQNKPKEMKKVDSFGFYHLCDDGTTNGYDSSKYRLAFPHEIPNNQQNDQIIDIRDTVNTRHGEGIVIGINTSNMYLVKGAYKFHNGKGNTLIKGNFSDKDDSYYYDLDELTLVKKANKSYIDIAEETVKLVYNVQLPIIGNIPTKTIFTFDIDIPKIKKDTIIELDTNLLKNIKKPIKF